MFLVRAFTSIIRFAILVDLSICGRVLPGEGCATNGFYDERRQFRIIHAIAALRMLANSISLVCQYRYKDRSLCGRGNEQLFFRGIIKACGIPLQMLRGLLKFNLIGTEFERLPIESTINFIRGAFVIPIVSASLFH